METASTYFTRRAGEERRCAVDASSAAARSAHLEMAVRLVRAAVQPSWTELSSSEHEASLVKGVDSALRDAFPLPAAAAFQHLLAAVDHEA